MVEKEFTDEIELEERSRFCPRCRRTATSTSNLCNYCGETLVPEGFCGVCERFWPHGVGSPCPKHEIPLEEAPLSVSSGTRIHWATIAAFPSTSAAEAARIRLEAEGIPTFLEGERMANQGIYQIATGGVRLQVPVELSDEARIILSQTWIPDQDETLEDAWEDFEPEPGANRRLIMKGVIVFILLLPAIQAAIMALTW